MYVFYMFNIRISNYLKVLTLCRLIVGIFLGFVMIVGVQGTGVQRKVSTGYGKCSHS